ncbi:signal transduction histidine kinase [Streptosporangium album]|uniref:histidine kinase n=1 Tax=Streptosporangium album TaxID=47479 RepID=A0A7W7W9Q2_9ACTN|nr:histidine kinase [Streptosporangium album]MBB4938310.1 signal transduction histidine kinase [Streptosporangium album]
MRRDDALWAVASFAGGLALLAAGAYQHRWAPAPLFVGPLAISCAGVAVRRSRPLLSLGLGVVAFLGDFAMGPSLGTVLIVTDNLYAAVRYGPRALGRWMLGITSVVAVIMGVTAGIFLRHVGVAAVFFVQAALVGVTPVFTGMIMRQLEDQAASERTRAEQVARLAELDRVAAVQAERARMARELHDMIANHFSAIAIQSTAVLSRKDLSAQTVRDVLESIRENSVQGMAEMRAMIGLLRQDGEDAEATRRRVAEVEELADRAREAGLEVRLHVDGDARELPASVDLAGYRIVQESLTNALKHGGEAADLVIGYRPGLVTLTVDNPIHDAGRELPGAGAGIIGMRERAALVGGVFEAGPHDRGWRVHAELPTGETP